MNVGPTDMKVRHTLKKFVEVGILDFTVILIFFVKT